MIGCDLPLSHSVSCKWQEWPSPALGNGGGGAHVHKCCGTSGRSADATLGLGRPERGGDTA